MYYYLFTIQYDGLDFCGWAKQKNQPTIQGELESALSRVARNSIFRIVGASKTDAKVHAEDQKAWVELNFKPNIKGFLIALNRSLPKGINILSIKEISKDFRVRNCKEKIYEYRIKMGLDNVFKNRYYFLPKQELCIKKIKKATKLFLGYHNFFNFSGLKENEKKIINPCREIKSIKVSCKKNILSIIFKAKGFIRYQIRMIVGACLAYSTNKISLEKIKNVLELKDNKLPFMANPEGLILKKIKY